MKKALFTTFTLLSIYLIYSKFITSSFGSFGLFGSAFEANSVLKFTIYAVCMCHITITCMSLSFHRYHTHKGVLLSKWIDIPMQIWLWLVTTLNQLEWVSVHIYHHNTSDTKDDPHSPVHKGFWHVLLLGSFDYTNAKTHPEVLKIASRLAETKLEKFFRQNSFLGTGLLTAMNILLFGTFYGSIMSVTNFLISPIFAIGGVNTLAHWCGYKNHKTTDNSRNIGYLVPLNFLICGELDHNNHHGHQKSCSFRHRWFEFDIGYFYINLLEKFKLSKRVTIYNPKTFKQELAKKVPKVFENNLQLKEKLERLAADLKMTVAELIKRIQDYLAGQKVDLELKLKEFAKEVKRQLLKSAYA